MEDRFFTPPPPFEHRQDPDDQIAYHLACVGNDPETEVRELLRKWADEDRASRLHCGEARYF